MKQYLSLDGLSHLLSKLMGEFSPLTHTHKKSEITDYSDPVVMTGATSSTEGKEGLVPTPTAGDQVKYLRGDGTWDTPAETVYDVATTDENGLMSASDKEKLDNIEDGANRYELPVATANALGGVKVGDNLSVTENGLLSITKTNVTSALGYTPPTADKNVNIEIRDGTTTNATLYPVGITSGAAGQTNNQGLIRYTDASFNIVRGTENSLGRVQLVLGNNISEGTDGNKQGRLTLYSANGKVSGSVVQEDRVVGSTQYVTNTLPCKSGTLLNTANYKDYVTAANIGADVSGAADTALTEAKTYTDTKVADLVDSAPETLNTLNELAVAIQEHRDVTDALDAAITNKVDKVDGMGLSTNDYTNEEKDKLERLGEFVGDLPVSTQIKNAISEIAVTYEMFGATLDGVADDTEAVIACHEFANEHGCKVEQHRGTLYLKTATADHCPIIKTSCDWSGMTILMTEEMGKNIIMKVVPDDGLQERMLTAEEIAQLTDDTINIGFLADYPNHICHFTTNIYIGNRSGFPDQNYVYHETVTVDRHGNLIDGRLFRHMTDATSVKMEYQSIFENPIEIQGAKIVLNTTDDSKIPTIYVSRSNTTVSNFTLEIESQTSTNSVEYKGEVFRITNCYNTVVEKISGENFGTFFDDGVENKSETCYVLFMSGLSRCTIRDCVLLRAWGVTQTQYCKDMIFKDSTFGRVDNHYHCRNYTVTNCTFATSHSCINIGYGDGQFVIDNVRFIKFNDPDTTFMNYCINLRGEFCALYSGELIIKNVYVENNTDQYINMVRGSYGSYYNFSDDPSVILPLYFPRTYIENVTYTTDNVEIFRYEVTEDSYPVVNGLTINVEPVEIKNVYRTDIDDNDSVRLRFTANYGTYSNVRFKGHEYGVIVTSPRLTSLRPQVVPVNMLVKDSYINGMSGSVKDNLVLYNCKVWGQDGFGGALRLFLQHCRIYMSSSDTIKFKPIMRLYMTDCVIERTGSVTPTKLDIPDLYHFKNNYYIGQLDNALAEKLMGSSTISNDLDFYLDDSLTVSGAAADSKITGDAISNLNTLVGDESVSDQINNALVRTITASSTDGVAYTATVPSITSLTAGISFIMIPNKVSTSTTPTLNVNSLGAKNIKRRISSISTSVQAGYSASWLAANKPFRVIYDGTQWIVEGQTKPVAGDLYGTLAVEKGGTGATDRKNAYLNIVSLGNEPIASTTDDTITKWMELGNGQALYATNGLITDQPSQYGILLNYVMGSEVIQIWKNLPNGTVYTRGGNHQGWNGTWNKIYDVNNKPTSDDVGAIKRGSYERIQGTADAHKDLNNYGAAGFYNVKTAYVDNCPSDVTSSDAVLLVYPWNTNGWVLQELTETSYSSKRWIRCSKTADNSTWGAWQKVYTTESKPTCAEIGAATSGHTHERLYSGDAQVLTYGTDTRIGLRAYHSTRNHSLYVYSDDTTNGAFKFITYDGSSSNKYGTVYTTLNKPTYSDVGAMALNPTYIEFKTVSSSGHGGYLDFHFNGSTADYTSRIIESASGTLTISGNLTVGSSLTVGSTNILTTLNNKANASHSHGIISYGASSIVIGDYTGNVPLMTARYNSNASFALQQATAGSNNVTLHTYSSTGAWQAGGTILTSNHLDFSLDTTTGVLTITHKTNP